MFTNKTFHFEKVFLPSARGLWDDPTHLNKVIAFNIDG
jgi:hypothetical protein